MNKDEALEVLDPSYSSSVHVINEQSSSSESGGISQVSDGATFGGIENSVDTSWSFQYGTYPFLHSSEINADAILFLGKCYLLGEELTPLLVNMRGVVEQVSIIFPN